MTSDEALDELRLMVAADSAPTLDDGELESLLVRARRPDSYALIYSDTGWTPTWDLNAAAAEGWLRKAGKVAGQFDFSTDGQSFSRQQQHQMCLEMAARYRRGSATSVLIGTPYSTYTDIAGNVNEG